MTNRAQDTVERMISQGAPFEDIERYIETLSLPSGALGALWLLAWAEATDPLMRRQVVQEALACDDRLSAPSVPVTAPVPVRGPRGRRRATCSRRC
jgi:hypothetical protein